LRSRVTYEDGSNRDGKAIALDDAIIDRVARLLSDDAEARQILPLLWRKGDADAIQRGLFRHFVERCVAALEAAQAKGKLSFR
jgi:hypothetical protein